MSGDRLNAKLVILLVILVRPRVAIFFCCNRNKKHLQTDGQSALIADGTPFLSLGPSGSATFEFLLTLLLLYSQLIQYESSLKTI